MMRGEENEAKWEKLKEEIRERMVVCAKLPKESGAGMKMVA